MDNYINKNQPFVGCVHFVLPCVKKPRGIYFIVKLIVYISVHTDIFVGEKAYYCFPKYNTQQIIKAFKLICMFVNICI